MSVVIDGGASCPGFLPNPWPPVENYPVLFVPTGATSADIWGLTDGSLIVRVLDDRGELALPSFHFQRIKQDDFGPVRILVAIANDEVLLAFNGIYLEPYREGLPVLDIGMVAVRGWENESPSTENPNRLAACNTWIQNRQRKFSTPITINPGRRRKSMMEQREDLRRSEKILRFSTGQMNLGRAYLLGVVASEIRALVHWTHDDRQDGNFHPLLYGAITESRGWLAAE